MATIYILTHTEVYNRSNSPFVHVSLFTNYEDAKEAAEAFHKEYTASESIHELAAYFDMNYNNFNGKGIWLQYWDEKKTYQVEVTAKVI